ncbi:Pyruvate/2-oxoglutarate dehydrogenase complex dihydrolipoamide acyltransferase (E2) component-like enzyme [Nitrosococcus oceani ATCC 19707]|uniref:Dihydrolipoamide acetyltransferase component of pyruvate dehydrogenase complex n=2 Tax=Nitrosococcus oceani TaxID=1229 RepID=Q3JB74_NITOC|nr:dihydrolipoamide acetyltransferase family protein [Nitrosococcus oceani]ABA57922.1 Pyruvate/2-oxoglutarate dehydrogenase complex dihydrolipoamide acyltransferase (E2) component-like enzyme [Nitrosococcus oceani ATCC 19707]EDZ67133.1 2-oxo acid dehydrogenases acyltransferase (catalytic domain) protein [Nitrosococcus oceani AFC27]KFI19651.1 branched-chain alpha-keto acid dehydrogenase subunit E2 [Nitrosococcus oceani C-27]GEM19565.1 branched-chain alpha-keto acid dehydrogenase subunit E2 [Nitr
MNRIFKLPDLGEGLTEAEIVEWHVKIGDEIQVDQPLVAVETAKAIVDIPSPHQGRIGKLYGETGDFIQVDDPLVEFETKGAQPPPERREDTGTVVGKVEAGKEIVRETATRVGQAPAGIKATPAVRALAHRLDVDLSIVTPTGADSMITAADIQRVAKILAEVGPLEPLRGVRRAMARTMASAHGEVVPVTVNDDADIQAWRPEEDITLRLIRAIVTACQAEPALNAWYDSHAIGRRVLKKIDLGIAVDTSDGLFVPVLRDAGSRDPHDLRQGLNAIKQGVRERKLPPEELRGYTFTLSNFGPFGGRYANPVVVPPTVAILGAGRTREAVVPIQGKLEIHRLLPLSLTFDHRAVTGGEAARFLMVAIEDLEKTS